MTTPKLFKTAAVFGAIAAAAILVCYRSTPHRPARHPLLADLQRLRTDTRKLLGKTTRLIDTLEPACVKLRETVAELDARRGELANVDQLQQELDDHQRVLQKYAALIEKNEGAVLPDGKYISAKTIRRQFAFEKDRHQLLAELHERRSSRRNILDRLRMAAQQQLTQATKTLADLRQTQEQLGQQMCQIEFLEQAFAAAGLSERSLESDVKRLQREVAAIQDQLDAQTIGLPEIIAIEPSEPADNALLRERETVR